LNTAIREQENIMANLHRAYERWLLLIKAYCELVISTASYARADVFGSGDHTFDIEFTTIGSPGNVDDTTGNPNQVGAVDYIYRIGKLEISEQMIDKANTLGGLGITKDARGPDKPVTGVNWNEAARFVNWLNTSTGNPPVYKFALQPGDAGYSANANIELWAPGDPGYDPNNLYRNSLALFFLPNIDEWYKAAYYDPASGVYYNYPTGSDSAPTPVASGTAAGTAVYNGQLGPADITLAGGLSPYGTMGQGGNAWEWEETDTDFVNGPSSSNRAARGGNWSSPSGALLSSGSQVAQAPTNQIGFIGFRVASNVPEPLALTNALVALVSLAWLHRQRFNRQRIQSPVAPIHRP
jgi:hypothetical protein